MDILIGLIPAIGWGLFPIVAGKIGGKPINEILGTTLGALLIGLAVYAMKRPDIPGAVFLFSFLSGASWAFGQMLQYTSFTMMGTSKAIPISSAMQLVGTSLMGVLFFGEWNGSQAKLIGFGAIAIIILGVLFTSYQEKGDRDKGNTKKGFMILLVSTIGYVGYSALPRFVSSDGLVEFFPQTMGMAVAAFFFSLVVSKGRALREAKSYKSILPGVIFGVGALAFLFSTSLNGVATGYALSQMSVVLATLGGILILGEKKTKKEMKATIVGLAIVVAGGFVITLAG